MSTVAEPATVAAQTNCITDEQAQFFADNGYLVLRGAVKGEELRRMQVAMNELTQAASPTVLKDPDHVYKPGHKTGKPVLARIEYVIHRTDPGKVLLANPFILNSVEKIIGPDLIPTWDSMVLKMPGEGIVIPWHRDAGTECVGDRPIFNVDFYMDEADLDTCLWVHPGSHLWSAERAREIIQKPGFDTTGAIPVPMQPGDVIFHNILVLHGSPANVAPKLRRVVYYEFRAAHVENEFGPHVPEYIPLKQKLLLACLEKRRTCGYIPADEKPFAYNPPAPFNTVTLAPGEEPPTYRYAHGDYWRTKGDRGDIHLGKKAEK
ncbi:MAG: phytanoyl-CoA dioxygenase family protein [Planctomycetota bacterium]